MFPALRKTATAFAIATALLIAVTSNNTRAANKERPPAFAAPIVEQDAPPAWCPVSAPSAVRFTPPAPMPTEPGDSWGVPLGRNLIWFGNENLWTMLPADGTWRSLWTGTPEKPGEFAYANKLPWFHASVSAESGPLTITGRRLDGPAPSFRENEWIDSFGRTPAGIEGMMGGIEIPAYGCWQVTGHFGGQDTVFTIWVAPRARQNPPVPHYMRPAPGAPLPIVKVDGGAEAKLLWYSMMPEIPPTSANVSGTVVLHAIINRDGRPEQLQYVSGPPELTQAAINAAQWQQYRIERDGVDLDTTIDIVFPPTGN